MLESWLAENALVIAGFIGTGGAALWRIQALEKRMEKHESENAREDRRRIYEQETEQALEMAGSRASYAGAASSTARGSSMRLIEMRLDKLR